MDNVKYYVDRDHGYCVAMIRNCKLDALNDYYRQTQFDIALKRPDLFTMDDVFVGVARCSPDDVFDRDFGCDLALQRARTKYMRQRKRILIKIADYIAKRAVHVANFATTNKKYLNY